VEAEEAAVKARANQAKAWRRSPPEAEAAASSRAAEGPQGEEGGRGQAEGAPTPQSNGNQPATLTSHASPGASSCP